MASTTFVDGTTPVVASWLNDVNTAVYTGKFGTGALLGGLTNPIISASLGANNYVQNYIYNPTNGTLSSADFAAYANNSTATTGFVDIGFAGQSYADPNYTVTGPNEAYLLGSAPSGSGKTGNLVLATDNTGTTNAIQFYTGGFAQLKTAWKMQIDSTGVSAPALTTTTQTAGDNSTKVATTAFVTNAVSTVSTTTVVPVRQTVLSGPVDTSGISNFGGSTGTTTVTASGTLIATAANGFTSTGQVDRVGSIVNPSWTGLSTNGTMYLYLDIAANGTCTTGSTVLAPTYRWGGADVVTNGQNTFNIQEMQMKVGNGSTAAQTYRVFVGEVTVAGAVVTAITWYALQGRYSGSEQGTAYSSAYSQNHNLGVQPLITNWVWVCKTADIGFSVGEELPFSLSVGSAWATSKSTGFSTGAGIAWPAKGGGAASITLGSWKAKPYIMRGW